MEWTDRPTALGYHWYRETPTTPPEVALVAVKLSTGLWQAMFCGSDIEYPIDPPSGYAGPRVPAGATWLGPIFASDHQRG